MPTKPHAPQKPAGKTGTDPSGANNRRPSNGAGGKEKNPFLMHAQQRIEELLSDLEEELAGTGVAAPEGEEPAPLEPPVSRAAAKKKPEPKTQTAAAPKSPGIPPPTATYQAPTDALNPAIPQPPEISSPIEVIPPEGQAFTSGGALSYAEPEFGVQALENTESLIPANAPLTPIAWDSLQVRKPLAQNAVPGQPAMLAYGRPLGATAGRGEGGLATTEQEAASSLLLEIVDDDPARRWSEDELLLIENVTDQLSLALENARLFEQTRQARDALQVSVRYQKSVADAVSILTERGFSAISEVLQLLGEAAQVSRVYYIETQLDHRGPYWRLVAEWHTPQLSAQTANPALRRFSADWLKPWIAQLEQAGFRAAGIGDASGEVKEFLEALGARSILQLPIAGQHELPGCLGFEQVEYERAWTGEEIAALQTAASALANTLLRENLFNQLQVNLSETEAQYQASAQLNSANEADEILAILRQFTILGHMNASNVSICLFDRPWRREEKPDWLIPIASWSTSARFGASGPAGEVSSPAEEKIALRDWKNAESLFSPDRPTIIFELASDPRLDGATRQLYVESMDAKSMLTLPLNVSGRWIGQIIALYNQTTGFTEREIRRLASLSGQAAVAVESLRLLEETRRRNEELLAMNQVTSAVSRTLELNQVLGEILERVLEVTAYDCGLISYVDRETKQLLLAVHRDLPERMVLGLQEKGLAGTPCDLVYRAGQTIYAPDLDCLPDELLQIEDSLPSDWPHAGVDPTFNGPRKFGFQAYLGAPISTKGRSMGTVCVFATHQKTVSSGRIALIEAISQQVGVAIENASLFQSTQIALQETEVLYRASSQLNAIQNYEDILVSLRQHTILGKADKLLGLMLFNHAWYMRGDTRRTGRLASTGELKEPGWVSPIAQWSGLPPDIRLERYELRRFPANGLLSHLHLTIVEEVARDTRLDEASRKLFQEKFQARSVLFAPLFIGNLWIGFIFGAFGAPTQFDETQIRRLTTLSSQAAISVQNLRLLDESRRRAGQLQTAAEIARDTSSTLALNNLLQRTVNLIIERFGFYHASIFLVDEENHEAVVRESTGAAGEEMKRKGHRLEIGGRSVIGKTIGSGKALVLNDVDSDEARLIHRPNPLLPYTHAELGIPLMIGKKVIGALDVQSNIPNSFTDDDVAVLQILSDQIAVAVSNAQSYELAQQAVEEIREADRLKSQFLANMSHELRTPLNSIIGFSRVILKGIDGQINDQQAQDLAAIYNSGQHLLGLINDVLDLSRIEAGKMDLAFEKNVNLAEIIRGVMSTTVGLVKDKPVELKQIVDPDLPLITADAMKVRQVLINLLSNASKFTERGSITVQAMRRVSSEDETQVIVRVIDTGPGIAQKDQAKLFQPFSQVDGSLTRKTGGSGLGLSISSHLIQMHHGEIGVESEPGKGSIFYFILPVHQLEGETDEEAIERPPRLTLAHQSLPVQPEASQPNEGIEIVGQVETRTFNKPRIILAIDPDHNIIDLYKRYLSGSNITVISLTRLEQAVTVARGLQPFAITLDLAMKGRRDGCTTGPIDPKNANEIENSLDGMQVLQQLKADSGTRNIPVIVCSMLAQQDQALALGAADYLLKPILEDDLVQAIRRLES